MVAAGIVVYINDLSVAAPRPTAERSEPVYGVATDREGKLLAAAAVMGLLWFGA